MKEITVDKYNLEALLNDLRIEDKQELIASVGNDYKKIFTETILKNKNNCCFLSDDNNNPLAIGGIVKLNSNYSSPWLISSNKFKYHKKDILKYVYKKINEYKKENNILFNYIYKSNFKALKWLKKFGFKTMNTNNDYKIFYFSKEKKIDIRYFTCK